jgi:hypothetical protein
MTRHLFLVPNAQKAPMLKTLVLQPAWNALLEKQRNQLDPNAKIYVWCVARESMRHPLADFALTAPLALI